MKYETVEPEDWEKIKDEIIKIEESSFEPEVRQDEDDIGETFTYEDSICLIAKNEEDIVGYIMGAPADFYEYLDEGNDTLYIESLAVLPKYRRRGIGTELKKKFIEEAKKRGYRRIVSHATSKEVININKKTWI